MERLQRLTTGTGAGLAEQIKRHTVIDMGAGPNAVDGFLHLAMPAIAALDRIGSGGQQPVIEKG